MSDRQEAIFYFEEAIKCHSEWGALKKANLLREKYSDLWEDFLLVKRPCATGRGEGRSQSLVSLWVLILAKQQTQLELESSFAFLL
jgi:hypothetical protein